MYPAPDDPAFGIFVRFRLQHIAARADLKLISPLPWIDYGRLRSMMRSRDRSSSQWSNDERIELLRPRWFYLPFGGVLNGLFLFLRALIPALRLRRRFPFEIIDAHFAHPDGVAAALLAVFLSVPFTVTLRGNEIEHSRRFWRRKAIRWALRRAAGIITVASNLRDLAIELGVKPERVRVIPNGVNSDLFFPRSREQCRARHGIAPDSLLVVSAGFLIERKGHHRTMQAVAALASEGIHADLWIVGGPASEPAHERMLRALPEQLGIAGRVHFFGQAAPETLAELMAAASVFCLATSREGWPNVVNEALACGTPVVASDTGGIPSLIPHRGVGIVVPQQDPEALRTALREALERDRRGEWDRAAIAAWGQSRGWERVAEETLEELAKYARRGRADT